MYPLYIILIILIVLMLAIRIYARLTVGICTCTTDLSGKTVLITGGNAGIGKETAKELAKHNAKVILACRNQDAGKAALEEIISESQNKNIVLKKLDLASFASVRQFAEDILKTEERLDILINNAGIVLPDVYEVTEDGCEKTMQINHFGHFLLTLLLLDLLKKSAPSRIINVASALYPIAKADMNGMNRSDTGWIAYANTKLANIHFTLELARKLRTSGVTVNCVHPGAVKTKLQRSSSSWINYITVTNSELFGKSPKEGAQTTLHAALSPDLENISGKYFSDCKICKLMSKGKDKSIAEKLWSISEETVGFKLADIAS